MKDKNQVLALYDVRGIQDYIFRTSKMKDAIGASHIVETLFENTLQYAVDKLNLKGELSWYDGQGIIKYSDDPDRDVTVLYIGGGNACVIFKSRETAVAVSKLMSQKTMEDTYSLQLAVAIVEKTDNYSADYNRLMEEMVRVKDRMMVSKPLDALPVMKVEVKTGYPMVSKDASRESVLKKEAGDQVRDYLKPDEKLLDNYIDGKGESSLLAAVHIDGNNMGLRIRELISGKQDYEDAVNEIRGISYSINTAYKKVFDDMVREFDRIRNAAKAKKGNDTSKWWIMKVIDAGDDITYVCNAGIAFATVEYFLKNISKLGMKAGSDEQKYKFSACAGISYFNSHFPFDIAYEVAEECCSKAKERAKEEEYKSGDIIGNWVDFQFCRSVHARNLDRIRNEEYVTVSGENLLRRPYYVYSEELAKGSECLQQMKQERISYEEFKKDIHSYVIDSSNLPRSFVKEMRNTYPLGENQMELLKAFLQSRESAEKDRKYPEQFYFTDTDGTRTALLYDALEVADYYYSYEDLCKRAEQEVQR